MTITGYNIKNTSLNHWNLLLREWVQCFERMCDYSNTTPYWNCKEDSNSGPFAGAIWRLGWTAFPEIKCQRTSLGGYGEVDFYVSCPPLKISEYIECKGCRISNADRAAACLSDATQHASTIKDDSVPLHIGVGFCNVKITPKEGGAVIELAKNLLDKVLNSIDYDAVSWCFPASVRGYEEERGVFSPGVILLAKISSKIPT